MCRQAPLPARHEGPAVAAINAKTGKVRWTWTDDKGRSDDWQIALCGNRLLMTNGPDVYAMPTV
ncbi:hypothetical protein [Streptomyces sp. NBC_00078]|uniref:hypothetical protein n=1 Tax=unclassified Streptomyces TaxID=2593676 RepID=UPI00224E6715|nr:hypothetical protein [Streptomyces sp. NBC_00078]MCX5420890.1 hypothetical protein [Streptomyces sp. NBC_00078]